MNSFQKGLVMGAPSSQLFYPRLIRRVRAYLIDSVLLVVVAYAWILCLPILSNLSFPAKMLALILPIMLIEPVLVGFTGGTIGHHIMGLRIRDGSRGGNIGILRATVRAVVRTLLGWFSFIFVLVTRRHQALHDYFTGSIVVLRQPDALPMHEKLEPRMEEGARYRYPSGFRRVVVIIAYALLIFVVVNIPGVMFVSETCSIHNHCTLAEETALLVAGLVLLFSIGTVIVLGWRGLLYGCRRSPLNEGSARVDHTFFRDR
jgi:uncharacterized RDD family membrane protein YckC